LKTSYFGKYSKLDSRCCISISQGQPKWIESIKTFKKLAPTWAMVKMEDEKDYVSAFNKHLSKLDPNAVYEELQSLVPQGEEAIIMCFEKPSDFCHRHIVAKWFENNLGIKIKEFDNEEGKRDNYRINNPLVVEKTELYLF
jgi:hypothetical protein